MSALAAVLHLGPNAFWLVEPEPHRQPQWS